MDIEWHEKYTLSYYKLDTLTTLCDHTLQVEI